MTARAGLADSVAIMANLTSFQLSQTVLEALDIVVLIGTRRVRDHIWAECTPRGGIAFKTAIVTSTRDVSVGGYWLAGSLIGVARIRRSGAHHGVCGKSGGQA